MTPWLFLSFDNTLVFSDPPRPAHYVTALGEHGVTIEAWQARNALREAAPLIGTRHLAASRSRTAYQSYRRALEEDVLDLLAAPRERAAIIDRVLAFQDDVTRRRLYPEAAETLAALHARGYRLALTANGEWDLPEALDYLGIAQHFAAVVVSAREGYRKPNPRFYEIALEMTGARPSEVWSVGADYESDVATALELGMRGVLVDRGEHGAPDGYLIADLSQLLPLLEGDG
ncbi:MAG: HAD family hydrolase [Chloroflexi bacterium]|nr:HAD family hydrolase [Chloroflexota bacterium]